MDHPHMPLRQSLFTVPARGLAIVRLCECVEHSTLMQIFLFFVKSESHVLYVVPYHCWQAEHLMLVHDYGLWKSKTALC